MQFPWEKQLIQALMIVMLIVASVLAIVINRADLSGNKKLKLFKLIRLFTLILFIPSSLYILLVQVYRLIELEYMKIDNALWRFAFAFGAVCILLIAFLSILPLTADGITQARKKSITASKYQNIFRRLRAMFIADMAIIIFCYWLTYMFAE